MPAAFVIALTGCDASVPERSMEGSEMVAADAIIPGESAAIVEGVRSAELDLEEPQATQCWANKGPTCTSIHAYPAGIAETTLVNAGVADRSTLDYDNIQVVRLASERLAEDRWMQVHHITFHQRIGEPIHVITVNDVSSRECSESRANVYLLREAWLHR